MRSLILFDDDNWQGLLPLTFTKPICELRVGILTIREKWEKYLGLKASYITQDFLSEKYPINISEDNIIVNSTILPTTKLEELINNLNPNEAILAGDELLAARLSDAQLSKLNDDQPTDDLKGQDISEEEGLFRQIVRPYDLFAFNEGEIEKDFQLITKGRKSQVISDTNRVVNFDNIFVEEGASVEFSILNAAEGPIYIGKDAIIMEGSMIRGSFALCDNAIVKMGARIYGKTTVGPYSKVAGEVNNSILTAFSNKGHEGYLGNSVLGEWCNIGADTSISNLKNNYDEIKLWSYNSERFEKSGHQFCGLIMGDHSKCGINTMFNTGTVIGVSSNIYGSGFPRNYIPSFAWGGASGFTSYKIEKFLETAERVMSRRKISLTQQDINILKHIFYYTAKWRVWEK